MTDFTFAGDAAGMIGDTETIMVSNLVAPGTYTSTETVPAGWDLTDISCDDQNSTGDTMTGQATFEVEPGETVTCTFENTRRGNIVIVKEITATGPASQMFSFTGMGPDGFDFNGGFTLEPTGAGPMNSDDTGMDFFDVLPGAYSIAEDNPVANGWVLTSSSCSGESTPESIVVSPGETVTCTFMNAPLGSTTVTKISEGGEGEFTFEWGNDTNMNVPVGASATWVWYRELKLKSKGAPPCMTLWR